MMNLAIFASQVLKPLNTFFTFVLLSKTYGQNNKMCLNHIFNIVKRYIYFTKCNERVLYIEHLMKIIKQQYCIEKELVKMYGKNEEMCRSKWQVVESFLID